MKNTILTLTLVAAVVAFIAPRNVMSHCQVPCGIYDDHARVKALIEDGETVLKATNEMAGLVGKKDPQAANQLVRWVSNKEKHSQNIIATLADYFLTQRVKPSQEDYVERLKRHHAIILAAMKAKQSADPAQAEALIEAIKEIAEYYPEEK